MTFKELHEILDNEDRKLTKPELMNVIYELKNDVANMVYQTTMDDKDLQAQFYMGEMNAFYICMDLLEHLEE